MEILVRFLFAFKIMNKFFYFFLLIFLYSQISIAQANEGNKRIESFSKSKNFLKKIHQESPVTFYCQCNYDNNRPNWESCGFRPRKDKKRASRIEWEHILPASYFGKKFKCSKMSVTNDIWKKIIRLPIYPEMSEKNINYILKKIKKFLV